MIFKKAEEEYAGVDHTQSQCCCSQAMLSSYIKGALSFLDLVKGMFGNSKREDHLEFPYLLEMHICVMYYCNG
jgi:hypothetical protein